MGFDWVLRGLSGLEGLVKGWATRFNPVWFCFFFSFFLNFRSAFARYPQGTATALKKKLVVFFSLLLSITVQNKICKTLCSTEIGSPISIAFHRGSTNFHAASLFPLAILGFTEFYRVLPGFT